MQGLHLGARATYWATGLLMVLLALPQAVQAGSFELPGGIEADYKLTFNYGLAVRTRNPSESLINGPIDPLQTEIGVGNQLIAFTHTGLPTTINFDDGNRNFRRGSLINNRASLFGELQFRYDNYGLVFSGSGFYDRSYRRTNDNDSPSTVNKTGPNDDFTEDTRQFNGKRARLLEAYAYGDWSLGDEAHLSLRVGQQLVAWGESLFLSGIASTQGPVDATKAFVPGSEIKDILLPVNQIGLRLSLNSDLTLLGQYKLTYQSSDIFPVGDYFSPSDAVGDGATFVYGSANPLYLGGYGCQGLLSSLVSSIGLGVVNDLLANFNFNVDNLCNANGIGGPLFGAEPYIYAVREGDITPPHDGQWGAGMMYRATDNLTLGGYWLRYHDTNPTVSLNVGFAPFSNTIPLLSTELINQYVPTSYNVKYFDGIHLLGISFSTVIGPFNVGGEISRRQGAPTPVETVISGVVSPVFTRSDIDQLLVSAIMATNPDFFFDDLAWVTEAGIINVHKVSRIAASPGITPTGDGGQLFYDRTSYGFQTLALPTRHNIINGWDFTMPISFGMIVEGNPAMAGAFGALYGEGDHRLSVGTLMTYLSNLQIGLSYNFFFGDTEKLIGNSTLKANPYADRDYATFNVKYNF